MDDLLLMPCPFCKSADAPGVHTLSIGVNGYHSGWCNTNYGGCGAQGAAGATKDGAIAAWNRRAPADPALLALAKFGAWACERVAWPKADAGPTAHAFETMPEYLDVRWGAVADAMSHAGLFSDAAGHPAPGIAAAIDRLLAPDGAESEVHP